MLSLRPTNHSPIAPVTPRMLSIRSPVPPTNGLITPHSADKASLPISKIANKPLKVDLRFSDCVSLNVRRAVNSLRPSVKPTNCSTVVGGNISLKASLTGVTILEIPLNRFLNDSIKSSRPPPSFQPCSNVLRASADAPIIPPKTSLISVRSSLVSSKSPMIISQV